MNNERSFDIAIVGAGTVGASLSALLASSLPSLRLALIDARAPVVMDLKRYDARVTAISKASEKVFREIGVWESVLDTRACPYFDMQVWDGEGTGEIHFDSRSIDTECLGHIVENSVLNHCLMEKIQGFSNVVQFHGNQVEHLERVGEFSKLDFDNDLTLQASLVVAADGTDSSLRTMEGFALRQWDYGHTAVVTTVKAELPHQNTAWQRFSPDGPLAFLPLEDAKSEHKFCSIVWSLAHQKAEAILALDDKAFRQTLSRAFEHRLGEIGWADARKSFPLRQRHAKRYIKDGLVLVGDAAHTIHPLAGLGANLGVYDVKVLAEEIERAQERGLALSEMSIIRRYERRRQAQNLLTMAAMEGFTHLFGNQNLAILWARNQGLRVVDGVPWLKNQFSRLAGNHF